MSFNGSALLDGHSLHRESHCHLRSLFPGSPPLEKKKSQVSKNMENNLLFHIWKTEGPGASGAAVLRDPVPLDPS